MVGLRAVQSAGRGTLQIDRWRRHWKKLSGGLPDDDFVGKIGIAIAPSNPNRLWAVVDHLGGNLAPARNGPGAPPTPGAAKGGVFVSDDAGATWRLVNGETRLWGRGWYFNEVTVDPTNPDRAYVMNTACFMTIDGGKTFEPVKGSPAATITTSCGSIPKTAIAW